MLTIVSSNCLFGVGLVMLINYIQLQYITSYIDTQSDNHNDNHNDNKLQQ